MSDVLDRPPPPAAFRIAYGSEPSQFGELRLPPGAGPHPVVVAIHGGFWRARYDLVHLGHLCAALTAQGFATWSLEYRRLGEPGGGDPGTLQDVARGASVLRELAGKHPLDLGRAIALGHSAGGHLALWLAARKAVALRGVVALAPVSDLVQAFALRLGDGVVEQLMGGPPSALPERYAAASPFALLPLGVPQRVIHGEGDDTVPLSLSQSYCAAARAQGDEAVLQALPAMGHFEPIEPQSAAWPAVLGAVRALLA